MSNDPASRARAYNADVRTVDELREPEDREPNWRVEVSRVFGSGYEACIRSATELAVIRGRTLSELMDLCAQWMGGYR